MALGRRNFKSTMVDFLGKGRRSDQLIDASFRQLPPFVAILLECRHVMADTPETVLAHIRQRPAANQIIVAGDANLAELFNSAIS
jgi:hypothetical protein